MNFYAKSVCTLFIILAHINLIDARLDLDLEKANVRNRFAIFPGSYEDGGCPDYFVENKLEPANKQLLEMTKMALNGLELLEGPLPHQDKTTLTDQEEEEQMEYEIVRYLAGQFFAIFVEREQGAPPGGFRDRLIQAKGEFHLTSLRTCLERLTVVTVQLGVFKNLARDTDNPSPPRELRRRFHCSPKFLRYKNIGERFPGSRERVSKSKGAALGLKLFEIQVDL